MKSRGTVCALYVALATATARAALPIGETPLDLRFLDVKANAPVPGVFAIAVETYYEALFHGSRTTCFRAATKWLDASGKEKLALPLVNPATSFKVNGDTRHIQVMAYRQGYCAAKPFENGHWAGFVKWANKEQPMGGWGKVESPDPGGALTIRMLPASDPPEHRLRHLVLVANLLVDMCYDIDRAYLKPVADGMSQEADAIAKTALEKFLAERIRDIFSNSKQPRSFPAPFVDVSRGGNVDQMRSTLESGKADIDQRNEEGLTALMAAARAMKPEAVKFLFDHGANIDALSGPGGFTALDFVLERARKDVQEKGTEGQEIHMLRMIDALVAHQPAPTLHPLYYEELSDPARWKLTPHLAAFWTEVRKRTARLEPRARVTLACPVREIAKLTLELRGDVK